MKSNTHVKNLILTAVCVAMCVVLPLLFHALPNAGSIYSPMHIPVLLCGLITGPLFGLLCGIAGPLLSSALTGMPMPPYLFGMMAELAIYGLVCGLMMKWIRTGKLYADLYISLIVSMLIGRVIAGAVQALIFSAGEYSLAIWTASYFVTALPGILIQLVFIPSLVYALMRAHLIPTRYGGK